MFRNLAILALSATATALTFNGTGQLRALSKGTASDDLGCLTDSGFWTLDNSTCGTFTATRDNSSNVFTMSTSDGPCELGTNLTCASNNTATTFWAWTALNDYWDFLAYGETITFSSEDNVTEADVVIRSYHVADPQPWIWLGWQSL